MDVNITRHAYAKAKQRLGWKKATLERMIPKVMADGFTPDDTNGSLNTWLKGKRKLHPFISTARIYGENIYFFQKENLVTLYRLPQSLVKYVEVMGKKQT